MSASNDFLARWSRRKRENVEADALPPAQAKHEEPDFDLASLPSLESITSLTDIKAFLQTGVPAELTRAALRRAWSADPAIRDFIGIAENQWDFTKAFDAGGPPGFGPLDPTHDISKMVEEIFGDTFKTFDAVADTVEPSRTQLSDPMPVAECAAKDELAAIEPSVEPPLSAEAAPQQVSFTVALFEGHEPSRSRHGGALPK